MQVKYDHVPGQDDLTESYGLDEVEFELMERKPSSATTGAGRDKMKANDKEGAGAALLERGSPTGTPPSKKRRPPSPDTVAAKRERINVWDEFIEQAESITGEVVYKEAITADGVASMQKAIEDDYKADEYEAASAHEEDSIAACGAKRTVVRAVISCMLSPGVRIETSAVVQARLWAAFPGGPNELSARLLDNETGTTALVFSIVEPRGMGKKFTEYICKFVAKLRESTTDVDGALEYLKEKQNDATLIEKELQRYTGVGPKLAALVAAFTCGAHKCAVDTNVHKLAGMLKWCAKSDSPESMQKQLNGVAPESNFVLPLRTPQHTNLRVALHCVLMELGKKHQKADTARQVDVFAESWAKRKHELQAYVG